MQGSAAVAAGRARRRARSVFEHAGLTGADAEHAWRTLRALVLGMSHIRRNDEASTVPTEDSFPGAGCAVSGLCALSSARSFDANVIAARRWRVDALGSNPEYSPVSP